MADDRLQRIEAEIARRAAAGEDPRSAPGLEPIPQPTGIIQREFERRGIAPSPAIPLNNTIDQETGASAGIRSAVGSATAPRDRLATLRQFFPDAQPILRDNFIYTNPETGIPTLYNPPGLDTGDFASLGPELGETVGGTIGGAAAVPAALAAAPPTMGASLALIPAGVGLGAGAGREVATLGASTFGNTIDTRDVVERLSDAGTTVVGNALGQRLGDVAGSAIGSIFGPVLRRPFSGTTTRQLSADFSNLGVRPLAGALTGNRATQLVEQGLSNTPGGASVIQRAASEAVEGLSRAVDDVATRYASGRADNLLTAQGIGERLIAGSKAASDRFTARQQQLYDDVYRTIPEDGSAAISAVQGLRNELGQQLQQAPESLRRTMQPALQDLDALIADAAQGGGIPFQALRQVRTDLGKRIGDPVLVGENSAQRQYLQRLYGALTQDMNAHAARVSPEAIRLLSRADRYTRLNLTQNIPVINRIIDSGTPEQAFRLAFGGPTTPGQAVQLGGTTLRQLRRNLQPQEWDVVAGSVLHRMGLARAANQGDTAVDAVADVFSPQIFITRWNQLSSEARREIFTGTRYRDLVPELNSLARVANALSQSEKLGNPSGTARAFLVGGTLSLVGERVISGQAGQAAAVGAGAIVGPFAAAKLITHPPFVRWLTGAMRTVETGGNMVGQIGRLVAIAEANPEIRDEIGRYIESIRRADEMFGETE